MARPTLAVKPVLLCHNHFTATSAALDMFRTVISTEISRYPTLETLGPNLGTPVEKEKDNCLSCRRACRAVHAAAGNMVYYCACFR